MGLEDVAFPIGEVNSDRESIEVEKREVEWALASDPGFAYTFVGMESSESDIKFIVSILDDIIQNEIEGVDISDDEAQAAKDMRAKILDYL